jgi:hypothetical protein
MKIKCAIILFISFISSFTFAGTSQCPVLKGEFFCKGVSGSHKDMRMLIREVRFAGKVHYEYTYEQVGLKAFALDFYASDEGVKNYDQDDDIGRCINQSLFLSEDGQVSPDTLFNKINADGDYVVIRSKNQSVYLTCKRLKN